MTDQNLTPEAVERLADECKEMGNQAHAQVGASKYMRTLWKADETLRALAQQNAALQAEVERLTKERDEARAERDALMADPLYIIGVNHGWDEAVENDAAHPAARPMQSMLADAERDMRQRAADALLGIIKRKYGDWRDYRAAILALPLKHADREGRAALAQGQKEGD